MLDEATRAEFDERLEAILAELPADIRALVDDVSIIVEDEPSREILVEMGIPLDEEPDLCGLHGGVPLSERSVLDAEFEPEIVYLFRGPIFRLAGSRPAERTRQIRITLLHELGHHFGLTEERLEELGYG